MADTPAASTASPPSMEDRIASIFDPAPEPDASEAAQDQPEQQTEEPVDDQVSDDGEDSDQERPEETLAEVQGEDGKTYKVPAALKDGYLRRDDYTRKTQETANLARLAQDRMQYAEAREQILSAVVQEFSALEEKRTYLKQLQSIDLGVLYSQDPGQAFGLQQRISAAKDELAQADRAMSTKAHSLQQALEQHQANQWRMAVEGVKQKISVTPQEDQAMLQAVQRAGIREDELKNRFADPRFLELVHKAAKYDLIQARKPNALQSANKAPPVVKPGGGNQMPTEVKQDFAFRKAMKSATSSVDKAKLIEARIAARIK